MAKNGKKKTQSQDGSAPVKLLQLEKDPNLSIPALWIDDMNLFTRKDQTTALMTFGAQRPDLGIIQQVACIQTSVEHMKKMILAMCSSIDYLPTGKEIKAHQKSYNETVRTTK